MKVILLQDVKKVGRKGQIVEVSDGYGRNYLLARKLAQVATDSAIHSATKAQAAVEHQKQTAKNDAQALAELLSGKVVRIAARTGENGKLFGAITTKEISDEIKNQLNFDIDKRHIDLSGGSIKNLGEYDAVLRIYAETTTTIKVQVVPQ